MYLAVPIPPHTPFSGFHRSTTLSAAEIVFGKRSHVSVSYFGILKNKLLVACTKKCMLLTAVQSLFCHVPCLNSLVPLQARIRGLLVRQRFVRKWADVFDQQVNQTHERCSFAGQYVIYPSTHQASIHLERSFCFH